MGILRRLGLAAQNRRLGLLWLMGSLLAGCSPKNGADTGVQGDLSDPVLLRIGALEVRETDLFKHLDDAHAGRRDEAARNAALDELGKRGQLVAMAFSSGLAKDPEVRAEVSRVLSNRVKELFLVPALKKLDVSAERLREIYETNLDQFQANEKRQVAVLWLNPGKDPERLAMYQEKLRSARSWVFEQSGLEKSPERGFAELAVDYSEHQASRFAGGIVGWMERAGGMDDWSKAVAEIVFGLKEIGEVSEVVTRAEGVFLVRYLALTPAITRSFETVRADLERQELRRLTAQAEADFFGELNQAHPIQDISAPIKASH
jgi:hypothetical protein